MRRTIETAEFLKSETLHDGVVLESRWEEFGVEKSDKLVVNVEFYVDYPNIERDSFLTIVFKNAVVSELIWPEFDLLDFDLVCDLPITFAATDSITGTTVQIECSESYIILDDTYIEYVTKYDRPISSHILQVND